MENKFFEILICAYGNHFNLIKKLLDSIFKYSGLNNKIHVGLNEGSSETKNYLRALLDQQKISTLIDSSKNINKDPMMRLLIDLVNTPYIIWFDDDCYVNKKNWDRIVCAQIEVYKANIFGFGHVMEKDEKYMNFLKKRSWYKNRKSKDENIGYFPIGGTWVGECEYLRKYNYPDRDMIKRNDDMLLGDLLYQTSGTFETLYGWNDVFIVNQSERRGNGENEWKNF